MLSLKIDIPELKVMSSNYPFCVFSPKMINYKLHEMKLRIVAISHIRHAGNGKYQAFYINK